MDFQTIILIAVIIGAGSISILGFRRSPAAPLSSVACVLGILSSLVVAAFGAFGFLASYELPAAGRLPWQLGYGLLIAGAVWITSRVIVWCSRRIR